MMTVILYFSDHKPVSFTGDLGSCALQVANAREYAGFVRWDIA